MEEKKTPNNTISVVNEIIEKAIKLRASDIHFEPRADCLRVRYRIDGLLHDGINLYKSMQNQIISRIKVMVNLDISESRLPQDGKTSIKLFGRDFDLRISTMPTIHGEKIVIRILERKSVLRPLQELGMTNHDLDIFKTLISKPHGLIIVSGPTGSGKTTTLYSTLNHINNDKLNIMTIEDPVEYELPNINQISVNYKSGLTFARGLRSVLRQDPDVIMVGEIRDDETAKIATQAALTGHLVFATLHANDCSSSIVRLIDMGVEPYLIKATLIGIVSQRLVRVFCKECKSGCKTCNFTGFFGRTGVFEILKITENIRSLIERGCQSSKIKYEAEKNGMKSLLQNGELLVLNKITSKEEIIRSVFLDY